MDTATVRTLALASLASCSLLRTVAASPSGESTAESAVALGAPVVEDTESLAQPAEPENLTEAFQQGHAWVKLRYRFEFVDQQGFDKNAYASTLRTALGYETAPLYGFKGVLEFQDVTVIGNELYNSTVNGVTDRPVVADPSDTTVTQAHLDYEGFDGAEVKLGRQYIIYDNHRFVGDVAWRQNYQTYDAARFDYTTGDPFRFSYAYVANVNRVFSDKSPVGNFQMSSHLVNAHFGGSKAAALTTYWYLLDVDGAAVASTSSLGARLKGKVPVGDEWGVPYALEYANQQDYADNPNNVDANYYLAELGASLRKFQLDLGFEVLSGSTTVGNKFSTPLATLHKFNGWADLFLVTPDAGLEDGYIRLSGPVEKFRWSVIYHQFAANVGGADYGTELDALLTRPLTENATLGLKYANYFADEFAVDVEKAWLWIAMSF